MTSVRLTGQRQRDHAKRMIDDAPDGYVMKLAEETRRDAQNRKLWPMLADIQRQVPGMETFSAEDMKLRFMDALGEELRFIPKLDNSGFFPVGHRTSTLTVKQFAGLIELLYKFGAENDVRWTPSPDTAT